jgi:hypothetical protein
MMTVPPDRSVPALPARLQPLPREGWTASSGVTVAQLRVRCGMRDCPGDFGRVALVLHERPGNEHTEDVEFDVAPGLTYQGEDRWAEGARAQRLRAEGKPPLARRPTGLSRDSFRDRPLGPYDLAPQLWGFDEEWNVGADIECPICHRLVRLDRATAYAALDAHRVRGVE